MPEESPIHWPISHFPVNKNELVVGGIPINQLAAKDKSTPFFVYDKQVITDRVKLLRHHLPESVGLRYAMKANPMPAVVNLFAKLVDGFDVSSIKEMKLALESGMAASQISFSGPGKTQEEIDFAVQSKILINLESEQQLKSAATAAKKLGIKPSVSLRVNPDFEVKSSKLKMGGGAKQFGVDVELVPALLVKIAQNQMQFEGFHIFAGSQNLATDSAIEILQNSFSLACRLGKNSKLPIKTLNIGGGFGIPYFPGDKPLEITTVGKKMRQIITDTLKQLPDVKITLELGRYLVGEAGVYIARIIDKKISQGKTFLIIDGGMNHHLAASGHLGQVIRKNYPVAIANRMNAQDKEIVSIVGPLCTPLDLLADNMQLPKAQIGDLVAIFQSGAYGLTASPIEFLGHCRPAEILI